VLTCEHNTDMQVNARKTSNLQLLIL